jgi:acyl-coenzyme A thioesterase PaaI-like protein
VVSSEYKINYLAPALGTTLIARAEAVPSVRNRAVCPGELFVVKEEKEYLCALAQGTINKMNQEE